MNPTVVGIVLIVAIVGYAIFSVTYKQKAGLKKAQSGEAVSYTHLTLPTNTGAC